MVCGDKKYMSENKRVLLFQGGLDTVDLFSSELGIGLSELGYEVINFDLTQSVKNLGLLYQSMQEKPLTAMIAFNSRFFGLKTPSGINVWETLGIPCINIFLDHPYWYHDILLSMPATGIVLCIDRNHMKYVNRFYPNIPVNGFLALGGSCFSSYIRSMSERKIDVLYAGSLYANHMPRKPSSSEWNFAAEKVYDRSIEYLLKHTEETIEAVIEHQLQKEGVILPDETLRRFITSCVSVERVVSSCYRERIVGAVAKAGISLELYGEGWDSCDWITLPNVHYGGRISPKEVIAKMSESKIVLNTFPWFKDGSHDRVFNAMLAGAAVVSEKSRYLEEVLPKEVWVPVELFDDGINKMTQRILYLLSHEIELQNIATAGYKLAISDHTWRARAQELHEDLLSYL